MPADLMHHRLPSSLKRIDAVFRHRCVRPIPRGELWLGRELFQRAGLTDTVDNHFRLAGLLGQEVVCLPVAGDPAHAPDLGYRYFDVGDLTGATRSGGCFVAAVIDGPFQALVNRMGLMQVLLEWVRRRKDILDAYAAQQSRTVELIDQCLAQGIHGVVIADDLSADRGPLISPADIDTLCGSFYVEAIEAIHAAGSAALIHCCGDIKPIVPLFRRWGVDGLAAVQHRANDLVALRQTWGAPLVIMAGIDAELLESDPPPSSALAAFDRLVTSLAPDGGLIMGSACGLYRGDFLPRIKALYARADRLAEGGSDSRD